MGDPCDLCPGFDDNIDTNGNGIPDGCDCIPVRIIGPPVSVTVCDGQAAGFAVTVNSDANAPVDYQWFHGGNPVGTNDPTFQIDTAIAEDGGTYRVDVTNECGTESASAVLTVVTTGPIIAGGGQPVGSRLCPGDAFVLSVNALPVNGGALSFQWQKGGEDVVDDPGHILGADLSTLSFTGVDAGDTGQYTVVIDEVDCGRTTSLPAQITVEDLPPVVSPTGPLLVYIECNAETYTELGATAIDECDGALSVEITGGDSETEAVDPSYPHVVTLVYSATDSIGQTTSRQRRVVVRDTTPPTFTVEPGDLIVSCSDPDHGLIKEDWLGSAEATDTCGAVSISHEVFYRGPCVSCEATVTWTASDGVNTTQISAEFFEEPDENLTGVEFAPGESQTLAPVEQSVVHITVTNTGGCPTLVNDVIVDPDPNGVAAQLDAAFPTSFLLCAGQQRAIPVAVDTTDTPPGTFKPTVTLANADASQLVVGTVEVVVSGDLLPNLAFPVSGGLTTTNLGAPFPPEPFEAFTIDATVKNNGVRPSSATTINFFEGPNLLGSAAVPALLVGADVEISLQVPGGLDTAFYLLRAEIVTPAEGELFLHDNSIAAAFQVGQFPPGSAHIDVQASVSAGCNGTTASVSGRAEYVIDNGIAIFRFPVQGGLVSADIRENGYIFGTARTVQDGSFSFSVYFDTPSTYTLDVSATDFTLTGEQSVTFDADECVIGGTPGGPGLPPPQSSPTISIDLYICSEDIQFAGGPYTAGNTAIIDATVHYYNSSGAGLQEQPVFFYGLEQTPTGLVEKLIGTRNVSFDGGGEATVSINWPNPPSFTDTLPEGEHVIRVELRPTVGQDTRNDVATRGLDVMTSNTDLQTDIAIELGGIGGCLTNQLTVSGRASYVPAGTQPPGEPVACGTVSVKVYTQDMSVLLGDAGGGLTRRDGYFVFALGLNQVLLPGHYIVEVTVTDGTYVGILESSLR